MSGGSGRGGARSRGNCRGAAPRCVASSRPRARFPRARRAPSRATSTTPPVGRRGRWRARALPRLGGRLDAHDDVRQRRDGAGARVLGVHCELRETARGHQVSRGHRPLRRGGEEHRLCHQRCRRRNALQRRGLRALVAVAHRAESTRLPWRTAIPCRRPRACRGRPSRPGGRRHATTGAPSSRRRTTDRPPARRGRLPSHVLGRPAVPRRGDRGRRGAPRACRTARSRRGRRGAPPAPRGGRDRPGSRRTPRSPPLRSEHPAARRAPRRAPARVPAPLRPRPCASRARPRRARRPSGPPAARTRARLHRPRRAGRDTRGHAPGPAPPGRSSRQRRRRAKESSSSASSFPCAARRRAAST